MADTGLKPVFGAGTVGRVYFGMPAGDYDTAEQVTKLCDLLYEEGVRNIDTAQLYGAFHSESLLGDAGAAKRFIIDTKALSNREASHMGLEDVTSPDVIYQMGVESVQRLKTDKVDVFYLDDVVRDRPYIETLAGVDRLYKAGHFERFGLSNHTAEEVQEVYNICKSKGWVLPTVFQGMYSAVSRRPEKELLPTLRKLGISFYAYSPIAGGFLTKTKQQIAEGVGRFKPGNFLGDRYIRLFAKPSHLEALDEWETIAMEAEIQKAEMAYRWVAFHSPLKNEYGDAFVFGSPSIQQVRETLHGLKNGPLPDHVATRINAIWPRVEHEASLDFYDNPEDKMRGA